MQMFFNHPHPSPLPPGERGEYWLSPTHPRIKSGAGSGALGSDPIIGCGQLLT